MIDTVRFTLRDAQWTAGAIGSSWSESASHGIKICGASPDADGQEIDKATGDEYFTRGFQHVKSALRIMGDRFEGHSLEVSLPRLIYGQNGRELRPEDCEVAMQMLKDELKEICPAAHLERLSRIDLVKNYRGSASEWVAMFRGIKHPKVRNKQREWFGTGLTWPGSFVYCNLYEKGVEADGKEANIMRLEFQLRGRECPIYLWDGKTINYAFAYSEYRQLAKGFDPRPFVKVGSMAQFLAWLRASRITVEGLRPDEVYLASKSRRQQYRIERDMRAAAPLVREVIRFEELLPEDSYPEWIDYEPSELIEIVDDVA